MDTGVELVEITGTTMNETKDSHKRRDLIDRMARLLSSIEAIFPLLLRSRMQSCGNILPPGQREWAMDQDHQFIAEFKHMRQDLFRCLVPSPQQLGFKESCH